MTELPRSNYSDFINEGQKNNDRGRKYKKDMRRGGADRDGVVGQRWATGLRRGAFLCCAWLAQTGGRTVIFHPKRRQENQLGSIVAMAMVSGQGSIATCFRAGLSRLSDPSPLIDCISCNTWGWLDRTAGYF